MTPHYIDPQCADVAPFLVPCRIILSRLPHETIGIGCGSGFSSSALTTLKIVVLARATQR
jgi:hypothetical protein